uniref:Uncharacterized protein n=1 Tax=Anopheles minimus TaxID=112268 RepID=A0A182WPG0_9DIPT
MRHVFSLRWRVSMFECCVEGSTIECTYKKLIIIPPQNAMVSIVLPWC